MAAEPTSDIWGALEFAVTALGGVWAGVKAATHWFTKREAAMKADIANVQAHMDKEVLMFRERTHKHGNDIAANSLALAVMRTEHSATIERLGKIECCIEKVNDKQDQQTEILLKIYEKR